MFDLSFFVHSFMIYPIVRKILSHKPYTLRRRIAIAIAFLAIVGIGMVASEVYSSAWEPNYFAKLEVSRDADVASIKRAYKTKALSMHPDKNRDDPEAESKFVELQQAYNTLLNEEARSAYDRWGLEGLKIVEKDGDASSQMMVSTGVFYLVWAVMTYILTLQTSHTNSRCYAYGGLGLMLAADVGMRYSNLDIPIPLRSSVTLFEKTTVMRKLYPSFMHGCNTIQMAVFVDLEKATIALVQQLLAQNKDIWVKMRSIEAQLESANGRRSSGRGKGDSGGMLSAAGPNGASINAAEGGSLPRNRGKRMPVAQQDEPPPLPTPPPKSTQIPSWVYFIGIMIFFKLIGQ